MHLWHTLKQVLIAGWRHLSISYSCNGTMRWICFQICVLSPGVWCNNKIIRLCSPHGNGLLCAQSLIHVAAPTWLGRKWEDNQTEILVQSRGRCTVGVQVIPLAGAEFRRAPDLMVIRRYSVPVHRQAAGQGGCCASEAEECDKVWQRPIICVWELKEIMWKSREHCS